jgi:3'-5' exonuclease
MIPEFRDILFVDIETVAATSDYDSLDERIKAQWARKAGYLRRDGQATEEQIYHDRAGIYAEFGRLCAHNGKEFDYPYLCRRMLINSIPLPAALNISGKRPYEVQHLDTMELWKFGDYKHFTSLDLLAAIFQIPTSKGDMDGSQVNNVYYQTGDLDKISQYCRGDVVVLAQLFLKLRGYPVISEHNIIRV